jgi:hypothetical protein
MRDINTGSRFGQNFEAERQEREVEKYGPRLPLAQMAAHSHVYTKHSIEPAYGQYDRPINESV